MEHLFLDFLNREARFLKFERNILISQLVYLNSKEKMNKMFGTISHNTLSILKMINTLLGPENEFRNAHM